MRSATLVINKNDQPLYPHSVKNTIHRTNGEFTPIGGLPQQFVNSMMTLFNMLDDSKTGLVPLVEFERRWREDAVPNLPGVVDALRTVAPPNGLLSFPMFVHGLRTALARARSKDGSRLPRNLPQPRNAAAHPVSDQSAFVKPISKQETRNRPLRHRRSNSGPVSTALVVPNRRTPDTEQDDSASIDAKISKENIKPRATEKKSSELDNLTANTLFVNPTRFSSNKPIKLSGKYIGITGTLNRAKSSLSTNYNSLSRPHLKSHTSLSSKSSSSFPGVTKMSTKTAEIKRQALETGTEKAQQKTTESNTGDDNNSPDSGIRRCNSYSPPTRSSANSASSTISLPQSTESASASFGSSVECETSTPRASDETAADKMKINEGENFYQSLPRSRRRANNINRRNDPRRHTVANGVDFNVLKCVKQIEKQMELLQDGLSASEQSRDWFQNQLAVARNKLKFITECGVANSTSSVGKMSTSNSLHGMSAMQDDLNEDLWSNASLQRSQNIITSLTSSVSSLKNITDSLTGDNSATGVADKKITSSVFEKEADPQQAALLQKVLSQNEKIAKLEKEKAVLVRQLFQTKAEVNGAEDTSIFI